MTLDIQGPTDLHHFIEAQEQPVFFLVDSRSTLERGLLERWLQSAVPSDLVHQRDRSCFLDLRDPERANLSSLQSVMEQLSPETLVVPTRVIWLPPQDDAAWHHRLLGSAHSPGWLRQHMLLRLTPERCATVYGEPATASQLQSQLTASGSGLGLAAYTVRQAVLTLKQVERSLRGRRYKEPAFVETDILEDPAFQDDLKAISHDTGIESSELRREAKKYVKELVPRSTPTGIDMLVRLSRFVYTRGYDREIVFDADQVERVRAMAGKYPVVFLCNHRSQVDSFSIYAGLYDQDLPHPHTFGGINMKMPVIGNIMRSSGMIFIRRAFSDNPVYKSVLQRYIDYLVRRRFPLLWSIEGGRSRTGKLVPPRFGLLRWLLNAEERFDRSQPLHLVPLSVVFEQVADVDAYTHEQLGGTKKPENLSWFFQYLRSFKTPLGKIHIRFGEPVLARVDAGQARDRLAVEKLAFETMVQLNACTPVTRASLICMALLAAAPQALSRRELVSELDSLLGYLRDADAKATFDLAENGESLLERGIAQLQESGVVQEFRGGLETVYNVAHDRELDAAYYRNNAIHYFFTGAIADLALAKLYLEDVEGDPVALFDAEVHALRKLFQWEFFFPESELFLQQVHQDLDRRWPQWREDLKTGRQGLRRLFRNIAPVLGHGALEPYLESYRVVAEQLAAMPAGTEFEQKSFIKQCLTTGRQLLLQRQLASAESIAKLMFETGIKVAGARGLLELSAGQGPDRDAYADEMRQLARRARALRSLASARRAGVLS